MHLIGTCNRTWSWSMLGRRVRRQYHCFQLNSLPKMFPIRIVWLCVWGPWWAYVLIWKCTMTDFEWFNENTISICTNRSQCKICSWVLWVGMCDIANHTGLENAYRLHLPYCFNFGLFRKKIIEKTNKFWREKKRLCAKPYGIM